MFVDKGERCIKELGFTDPRHDQKRIEDTKSTYICLWTVKFLQKKVR
jgi:hypothetical protein